MLAAGLLVPPGQVVAVGVAGEAVEDVDRGVQVVPLVEDLDPLDPLGDLPAQRPLGLVADDHDRVVGVGDDVPQVVADPARLAHARRGDDHHRAVQVVEPPRVVPARAELDVLRAEVERVLVHQAAGLRRVGLGMVAVDLGQAHGQRAVDVDRDRPDLVQREELLEAVDHPLGPAQAEGRDDDLALQPDRPGDDRVQLLDQPVVRIELAVAVGALGDQDVDVLDRRRIGQEVRVAAAQVAGEDEPARPAVFAISRAGRSPSPGCARRRGRSGSRPARPPRGCLVRRRAGAARPPTRRRPARRAARAPRCGDT